VFAVVKVTVTLIPTARSSLSHSSGGARREIVNDIARNARVVDHDRSGVGATVAATARIEGTGGDFLFYEEGVTESVGRLI
jgi:hypothetical protein